MKIKGHVESNYRGRPYPLNLKINNHAILRYIQRHYGFDLDFVVKEMEGKIARCKSREELERLGFRVGKKTIRTYIPRGRKWPVVRRDFHNFPWVKKRHTIWINFKYAVLGRIGLHP